MQALKPFGHASVPKEARRTSMTSPHKDDDAIEVLVTPAASALEKSEGKTDSTHPPSGQQPVEELLEELGSNKATKAHEYEQELEKVCTR